MALELTTLQEFPPVDSDPLFQSFSISSSGPESHSLWCDDLGEIRKNSSSAGQQSSVSALLSLGVGSRTRGSKLVPTYKCSSKSCNEFLALSDPAVHSALRRALTHVTTQVHLFNISKGGTEQVRCQKNSLSYWILSNNRDTYCSNMAWKSLHGSTHGVKHLHFLPFLWGQSLSIHMIHLQTQWVHGQMNSYHANRG